MKMLVYYRLHSCSFLSACFRETQVFNMDARSLAQTKWSFRPKIWAANWAAASGERTVEQPRPKRVRMTECLVLLHCTLSFKRLGPVRFNNNNNIVQIKILLFEKDPLNCSEGSVLCLHLLPWETLAIFMARKLWLNYIRFLQFIFAKNCIWLNFVKILFK